MNIIKTKSADEIVLSLLESADHFLDVLKAADPQVLTARKQPMIFAESKLRSEIDRARTFLAIKKN